MCEDVEIACGLKLVLYGRSLAGLGDMASDVASNDKLHPQKTHTHFTTY